MVDEALTLLLTWVVYLAILTAALYVVTWPFLWLLARRRGTPPKARGWRPWAAWLVFIVLIAAAAPALEADVERRGRIGKARGNVLLLGKAVAAYAAHCGGPPPVEATGADCPVATSAGRGRLPRALMSRQRNARGVEAGPFVSFLPRLPQGWQGADGVYAYVVSAGGRARVCASGDGVTADSAAPTGGAREPC